MNITSYVAGVLFFVLATISRSLVHKYIQMSKKSIIGLFSAPSPDYPEDIYASIGQCMGILWILIGVFLTITKHWFSSSASGVMLEPLIVFIPFIVSGVILRVLTSNRKK